jgi:hypothetical protein
LLRSERQSAQSPHCAEKTGTTVSPTATSTTPSPTLSTTLVEQGVKDTISKLGILWVSVAGVGY